MEAQPPGGNNGKREARKCQERGAACIRKYPKAKHQGRESSVCYFRILAVSDNSSFQFSFALPCLVSFQRIPLSHFPSKASLYSARPGDRPLRKAPAYRILQLPQSRTCHLLSNETSCWGKGIPSSICSTLSPHSLAFLSPRIYNRPIRLDRIVPMAPSMLLSKRDCNQYDGTDCWDGSDWWWSSVSIHGSSRAQDSG